MNAILLDLHSDSLLPAPIVGEHWSDIFLDCHTEYVIRKQRTLNADRQNSYHPESILDWFTQYKSICEK